MLAVRYSSSDASLKFLEKIRYPPKDIVVFFASIEEEKRFRDTTPFYLFGDCVIGDIPEYMVCIDDVIEQLRRSSNTTC